VIHPNKSELISAELELIEHLAPITSLGPQQRSSALRQLAYVGNLKSVNPESRVSVASSLFLAQYARKEN